MISEGWPTPLVRLLQLKGTSNQLSGAIPDVSASWSSMGVLLLAHNQLVDSSGH